VDEIVIVISSTKEHNMTNVAMDHATNKALFEKMGVGIDIDIEKMIAAGKRSEDILGRKLRSNFVDAGPAPHQSIRYGKEKGIL